MKLNILLVILFGLVIAACSGEGSTTSPTTMPERIEPNNASSTPAAQTLPTFEESPMPVDRTGEFDPTLLGTVQRNLTYCITPQGEPLAMDVYYPAQGQAPFPLVLYVHGGSWVSGSKAEGEYIPNRTALVHGGNVFVSINYRLAPTYRFPAQIEDVKCAVRSLRANAAAFGIDPERVAAMGSSAGGHLVSLLGTSAGVDSWDAMGGYEGESSRVQAVVDLFGPAVAEGELGDSDVELLSQVFGARSLDDPNLIAASPAAYISPDDPPFLILHGTLDSTVPLSQSQRFTELLQQGGVDATLLVVENAGHGIPSPGMRTNPSFEEVMQSVHDFLDRTIGR